jgi:hypothetical protein
MNLDYAIVYIGIGRTLIDRATVAEPQSRRDAAIRVREAMHVVTSPAWRGIGGTRAARTPRPSFVSVWNWLGLIPVWDEIPVDLKVWGLALLALPLFLGHLMLWQARRLKHHRAG